jgi:hypothetical protein
VRCPRLQETVADVAVTARMVRVSSLPQPRYPYGPVL